MLLPAICLDYKLFSFHLQVLPDDDVMADLYQTAIEVWNEYSNKKTLNTIVRG
jgi:hypothetical protein